MKKTFFITLMVLIVFALDLLGASYKMTIKSAQIAEKKSNGLPWDSPPLMKPEPYVKIFVDNRLIYKTDMVKDTYSPVWNESFSFSYKDGQNIKFEVWDEDLWSDDLIGNWHGTRLPDGELSFGRVESLYVTVR